MRSCGAPVARATTPVKSDAATPAAQMTVRAWMRSLPWGVSSVTPA